MGAGTQGLYPATPNSTSSSYAGPRIFPGEVPFLLASALCRTVYLALTGCQSRTLMPGLLGPASFSSLGEAAWEHAQPPPHLISFRTCLFHVCSKTTSRARMAKKMFVWRDRDKRHGVCGSGDKKVGHLKNFEKGKDVNYAAKLVFPTSYLFGGSLEAWPEAARPLTEPREWRCCLPPRPALRLPTSLHPVRSWGEG